jgi:hypothetical protein
MTPEQKQARRAFLGASEIAEVLCLGFSGLDGPARVYRSKVEPDLARVREEALPMV